ncbi:MAG: MBL fold metallo-hydrolase [Parcubacteria group bacterium]|nr:MBL fold metallo-hydrolase [Parcubacteria group bacterium]
MHIAKLGHCCLIIEVNGLRILTDPGMWTIGEHSSVSNVDVILITHDHSDHMHADSIKTILANNPNAKVYANSGTGQSLSKAGLLYEALEGTSKLSVKGVELEAFDCIHESIYQGIAMPQNTGYWIGGDLFYPGDSLTHPGRPVNILALPVSGPWMMIGQGIDYAKNVRPKKCFPVHDGFLKDEIIELFHGLPQKMLADAGIAFTPLKAGESAEF